MTSIETIAEIQTDGQVYLKLPSGVSFLPGVQKIILIIQNEEEQEEKITPELEEAFKAELDNRSLRIKNNPHPGFTMEDVANELEVELGRKIQIRA
ncbi:MAG: hypothetical protein IPL26_29155 [Leptospiraceae bacterium]|nr:hypothetical protein [Leptospiraceae bacterium]